MSGWYNSKLNMWVWVALGLLNVFAVIFCVAGGSLRLVNAANLAFVVYAIIRIVEIRGELQ